MNRRNCAAEQKHHLRSEQFWPAESLVRAHSPGLWGRLTLALIRAFGLMIRSVDVHFHCEESGRYGDKSHIINLRLCYPITRPSAVQIERMLEWREGWRLILTFVALWEFQLSWDIYFIKIIIRENRREDFLCLHSIMIPGFFCSRLIWISRDCCRV